MGKERPQSPTSSIVHTAICSDLSRGALDHAWELGTESLERADRTDWLNLRGDAHLGFAHVLSARGDPRAAAREGQVALDIYERKGNRVGAGGGASLREDHRGRFLKTRSPLDQRLTTTVSALSHGYVDRGSHPLALIDSPRADYGDSQLLVYSTDRRPP